MQTTTVAEEGARFVVPEGSDADPFHKLAFYNPAMAFSRTMGSVAVGAAKEKRGIKTAVDGLCGTGARGIRYALENDIDDIFLVDANPDATKLARQNVKFNKLNANVVDNDVNAFLSCHEGFFDLVELDPFGTPAPFLDSAARRLSKRAVISVTATDLAKLCGREPGTCVRNYSSKPMVSSFSHETALRILLRKVAASLAVHGTAVEPALCFYQGHYAKVIAFATADANKAVKSASNAGYALFCRKCLYRGVVVFPEKTCQCGGKLDYAGPLWLGDTSNADFVSDCIKVNDSRDYSSKNQVNKLLGLVAGEIGMPPLFYDIHELTSWLGSKVKAVPKTADFVDSLRSAGFNAVISHYEPRGISTDAPVGELKRLLLA